MSADGEVEVSVRAEGAEDAAGELGGGGAGGAGGGGGGEGGQGGIGEIAGNTGRMVKLLAILAAVMAVVEDIIKVVSTISQVLQAFLAPVAVMLMRVLQPTLRWMLEMLPKWIAWLDENEGLVKTLLTLATGLFTHLPGIVNWLIGVYQTATNLKSSLEDRIDKTRDRIGDIVAGVRALPGRIWTRLQRLPGQIGSEIRDVLPDTPSPGDATSAVGSAAQTVGERIDRATGGRASDVGETIIEIGGGVVPFVDEITKNGSIDFP